jgi:hypothetical protein
MEDGTMTQKVYSEFFDSERGGFAIYFVADPGDYTALFVFPLPGQGPNGPNGLDDAVCSIDYTPATRKLAFQRALEIGKESYASK